ncbi:MAG: hypothetical protein WAN60_22800 [Candidatus Sulfotelmatobacter sp.]
MPTKFSTAAIRYGLASLLAVFGLCAAGQSQQQVQQQAQRAQQPVAMALLHPLDARDAMEPVRPVEPIELKPLPEAPSHRRFWDRENTLLFAGTVLTSAGDFVVTRNNLQGGGQELNPVARIFSGSTAGLAVNFVGETAGVTGLSYIFHKMGHHRLERLTPMVNMAASGYAIGYGLRHR